MSAVLNMKDDTFMCKAIKSDEARPRGISRIYSFSLHSFSPDIILPSLSLSRVPSFISSPQTLLLFFSLDLTKKHSYPPYETVPSLFLILLSYPPSASQSVYLSSQRSCVCHYLLPLCLSQSCLISVDLVVLTSPVLLVFIS